MNNSPPTPTGTRLSCRSKTKARAFAIGRPMDTGIAEASRASTSLKSQAVATTVASVGPYVFTRRQLLETDFCQSAKRLGETFSPPIMTGLTDSGSVGLSRSKLFVKACQ